MKLYVGFALFMFLLANAFNAWGEQPFGIKLSQTGKSFIYPVVSSGDWQLTQPSVSQLYAPSGGSSRVTHWADDYYAQDWARGCGKTHGQQLFAGISGVVVMAGSRGPYGNTVVIYDEASRFALKYSHLSEIWVSKGEYVIAGQSFIGRVGNTGTVSSAGCSQNPGAHLHLSLYRNVGNPNIRPITTTSASSGVGPTSYAAPFGYATSTRLVRTAEDPTVFVISGKYKIPVTATAYFSHGWGFDKSQKVFNSLAGGFVTASFLSGFAKALHFWPLRDHSLIKDGNSDTVYQFEDRQKLALTYEVFSCRLLRFGEVASIPSSEVNSYKPAGNVLARGCVSHMQQAMRDFARNRHIIPGIKVPVYSSYAFYPGWDPSWELRAMDFSHASGQPVTMYHATQISDPSVRFIGFTDPYSRVWAGWFAAQ